jgi:hypothetical protein
VYGSERGLRGTWSSSPALSLVIDSRPAAHTFTADERSRRTDADGSTAWINVSLPIKNW